MGDYLRDCTIIVSDEDGVLAEITDLGEVDMVEEIPQVVKVLPPAVELTFPVKISYRTLRMLEYGIKSPKRWRQKVKARKAMLGYWLYKLYCETVADVEGEAHHAEQ